MSTSASPPLPPNLTEDGGLPDHPSDVLINLIAALLTPMFIGAAGGDYRYARAAALETVWSYRAATQADLLQVVQIIAFSLAALRTLCVSMSEEVTIPTLLRLNSSADRMSRAQDRLRAARRPEAAGEGKPVSAAAQSSRSDEGAINGNREASAGGAHDTEPEAGRDTKHGQRPHIRVPAASSTAPRPDPVADDHSPSAFPATPAPQALILPGPVAIPANQPKPAPFRAQVPGGTAGVLGSLPWQPQPTPEALLPRR